MEIQSFNTELGLANMMFLRIFNNIQINRHDQQGNEKFIKVKCQFGQRSRIFKSWQNNEKNGIIKLPIIIINRTGYSRNSERLNNLHNEVKYEIVAKNRKYDLLTPVPIDINYDLTIVSKYSADIDQIASNFMVFFNSDGYVTCEHPKYEGLKLNNQVILQDTITEEHPDELDGSQDDFITSTFQFTFKTYLFGGQQKAKIVYKKTKQMVLSTFISSNIVELKGEDINKFMSEHPTSTLSATLSSEVTEEVPIYKDSDEISDQVYDGFTPIIKNIDIKFYPTPYLSSIPDYIYAVDNMTDVKTEISGYISSDNYLSGFETYIDEDGNEQQRLSSVQPVDMKYEYVTEYGSLYPYVDAMIWKINEDDINEKPYNLIVQNF